MSESANLVPASARPPIGFIVEGKGEFSCYPSLVCRTLGTHGLHVPLLNAGGNGGIIRHLAENLDDLCNTHKPHIVIITIDLRDVLAEGHFGDCHSLKTHIDTEASEWLQSRSGTGMRPYLPSAIISVIQVQSLESWLLADCQGLSRCEYFSPTTANIVVSDVDSEIPNPHEKLLQCLVNAPRKPFDIKKPRHLCAAFRHCDVSRMEALSRSFRKFAREVRSGYNSWLALLTQGTPPAGLA